MTRIAVQIPTPTSNVSNSNDTFTDIAYANTPYEIPDTGLTVKNSANTTLISASLPSAVSHTRTVGDSRIIDSDLTVFSLPATAPFMCKPLTDAVVTIQNDDVTPTFTATAQGQSTFTIPKVFLTIKNSINKLLFNQNINSAFPFDTVISDSTIIDSDLNQIQLPATESFTCKPLTDATVVIKNDATNPTFTEIAQGQSTFILPKILVRVLEDGIEQTSVLINSVENIDFKLQY